MGKTRKPHPSTVKIAEGSFVQIITPAGDTFLVARVEATYRDATASAITTFLREVLELGVAEAINIPAEASVA